MRPITQEDIKVLGRIVSISTEGVVADALQIWDSEWPLDVAGNEKGWDQQDINKYFRDFLAALLRGDKPFNYIHITGNLDVDGQITTPKIITDIIESKSGNGFTFNDDVNITGNLNVAHKITGNDLQITGNTHLNKLTVDGVSTFNSKVTITSGGIDVHGASKFFDNVTFDKNVQINGNLTVNGHTTLNTVTANQIDVDNLNVNQHITIGGQTLDDYITNIANTVINNNADLSDIKRRLGILENWKLDMETWRAKIEECYQRMCGEQPVQTWNIEYVGNHFVREGLPTTAQDGESKTVIIYAEEGYGIYSVDVERINSDVQQPSQSSLGGGIPSSETVNLSDIHSDIRVTVNTSATPDLNITWYFDGNQVTLPHPAFTSQNPISTIRSGGNYSTTITLDQTYATQNNIIGYAISYGEGSATNSATISNNSADIFIPDVQNNIIIRINPAYGPVQPTNHTITKIVNINGTETSRTTETLGSDLRNTYTIMLAGTQTLQNVTVSPQNANEVSIDGADVTISNPSSDYTITWNITEVAPSTARTITQVVMLDDSPVSTTQTYLNDNETATFNTPTAGEGTQFYDCTVSPMVSGEIAKAANGTVIVTNPSQDYTITWYFVTSPVAPETYTITFIGSNYANATNSARTTTVVAGGSYTNTITANTNYWFTVTDNGTELVENATEYTINLTNIQEDHTIGVYTEKSVRDILILPHANNTIPNVNDNLGSISVNGTTYPLQAIAGQTNGRKATVPVLINTITYTPAAGSPVVYDYSFSGITDDGNDRHQNSQDTFSNGGAVLHLSTAEMSEYTFCIVVKEDVKLSNGSGSATNSLNLTFTPSNKSADITVSGISGNPRLNPNNENSGYVEPFTFGTNESDGNQYSDTTGTNMSNPFNITISKILDRWNDWCASSTAGIRAQGKSMIDTFITKQGQPITLYIGDSNDKLSKASLAVTFSGFSTSNFSNYANA